MEFIDEDGGITQLYSDHERHVLLGASVVLSGLIAELPVESQEAGSEYMVLGKPCVLRVLDQDVARLLPTDGDYPIVDLASVGRDLVVVWSQYDEDDELSVMRRLAMVVGSE
jgi:hypothetical protein